MTFIHRFIISIQDGLSHDHLSFYVGRCNLDCVPILFCCFRYSQPVLFQKNTIL